MAHAFEDRYCHRGAPLSIGKHEGDFIRCMYHGLKYDMAGKCVEAPGQERIHPRARVWTFAVQERNRWLWVWMGDPGQADPAQIPDTHWLDDPNWTCTPDGYLEEDRAVITAQARALAAAPDSSMIPFAVDTALSHFRRLIKRTLASEGKSDGPRI
jgi:hypothetical protein